MSIVNRKARFEYHIIEEYEAGINLFGSEVKSLRMKGANISDTFCYQKDNEIYLKGMFIPKYEQSSYYNHEEKRDRKLLLHKKEIKSLIKATQDKGITIVPLSLYISRGRYKVRIGVCKGKKLWDRRESIKERDIKRENERN
jgi:SsrA-binding protein